MMIRCRVSESQTKYLRRFENEIGEEGMRRRESGKEKTKPKNLLGR